VKKKLNDSIIPTIFEKQFITMLENITRFNVRVYGILVNEHNHILVSDELIRGAEYTKFPGGGLEFGEGTRSCLIREFKEETGQDISVHNHIYTTDFFVQSAFRETDQLISLYYQVTCPFYHEIPKERKIHIAGSRVEHLEFLWVPLAHLTTELLTFPIDKHVVNNYLTAL
jgi:8-oxo-dGTP pyrophosphatase MutT (NUDIX family)